MKTKLLKSVGCIILAFITEMNCSVFSQGNQVFKCDGKMYQAFNPSGTWLFVEVNSSDVSFRVISDLQSQGLVGGINALAYNPNDNLIYGISPNAPHYLYRLDANGTLENRGTVAGLPDGSSAGAMDNLGSYYISGSYGKLYRLNIQSRQATLIGNTGIKTKDIAFNPLDGMLYGWSNQNQLCRINPINGQTTAVGSRQTRWTGFGAMYFNAQGEIIAYGDDSLTSSTAQETLVKIDTETGLVTVLGTGPEVKANDGCSCAANIELTKTISSDTLSTGQVFTYTFTIFNQSGINITDSWFYDELPDGFTCCSQPYALSSGLVLNNYLLTGLGVCNFRVPNIPLGISSFKVDILVPSPCQGSRYYSKQAELSSLPAFLGGSVFSDNPETSTIDDPTGLFLSCCPPDLGLNFVTTQPSCNNSGNGSVLVSLTLGVPPYTCTWSDGCTLQNRYGLHEGDYRLLVTDRFSCSDSVFVHIDGFTDTIAPRIINCPPALFFSCLSQVPESTALGLISTDNCDSNPQISISESTNGGQACGGSPLEIYRTYTATDVSGNTSSCTQKIVVRSDTLSGGLCLGCDATMRVAFDCTNPSCVYVSSCKNLSNVVLMDCAGHKYKFDKLSGKTGYFCHPAGLAVTTVWVKSGCFMSGDGPGYGRRFDHPCNPCASNKSLQTDSDEPQAATDLIIYPNPFKEKTTLDLLVTEKGYVNLKITDLNGKVLEQFVNGELEAGSKAQFEFRTQAFHHGIYFVVLSLSNGETRVKKLICEE